jgi:glycosyltransferase involved in cell wall biosynthesis
MALPDRWVSWFIWAVPRGLHLIYKYKPKVIWSTYPIATANLVGATLHRITGIPWIADFRDPMTEIDPLSNQRFPQDANLWRVRSWIEKMTVKHCNRATFVTTGAFRIYSERYPDVCRDKWAIIPNGYDEEQFVAAAKIAGQKILREAGIVLLHSGTLYPTTDRDPSAFFDALGDLKKKGKVTSSDLRVVLRASGYEERYRTLIQRYGIEDIVFLRPALPYREALAEMLHADGLLIFQGHTSNPAIPAKLYEYLRAQRPIFALADSAGDTANTLREAKVGMVVPLDAETRIAEGLLEFLELVRRNKAPVLDLAAVRNYSRKYRAQELAHLLESVGGQSAQE